MEETTASSDTAKSNFNAPFAAESNTIQTEVRARKTVYMAHLEAQIFALEKLPTRRNIN